MRSTHSSLRHALAALPAWRKKEQVGAEAPGGGRGRFVTSQPGSGQVRTSLRTIAQVWGHEESEAT